MAQRPLSPSPDHQRLELALQSARMGEFEMDFVRDRFVVSERLAAITGVPAGEIPANSGMVNGLHVHPDDIETPRRRHAEDSASTNSCDIAFRFIRPNDKRLVWLPSAGAILRDKNGHAIGQMGIIQDDTERRLEEERRMDLMAELDHRVTNVLGTVQTLVAQTIKRTTSLTTFLRDFSAS